MKYTYKLKPNHILQGNFQNTLPLKSLVQNSCLHIEIKYGMEKYDYIQLLQEKSMWDYYHTSESSAKEMTIDMNKYIITRMRILVKNLLSSLYTTLTYHTKLVIIRFLVFFLVPENVVVFLFLLLHLVNR